MKYLYLCLYLSITVLVAGCDNSALLEARTQEKLSAIHNPQINDIYMYTFPFDPFALADKEYPVKGYKLIKVDGDMRYFTVSEYTYGTWDSFLSESYPPHKKMVFLERIVSAPVAELALIVTSRTNVNESRVTIYRSNGEAF